MLGGDWSMFVGNVIGVCRVVSPSQAQRRQPQPKFVPKNKGNTRDNRELKVKATWLLLKCCVFIMASDSG